MEHGTPPNASANNATEPNLPAAVAVHPTTANSANVSSGGAWQQPLAAVIASKNDISTLLSLLLLPRPVAKEAPSLSLNLLDDKISDSNTTVDGKITRIIKHATNTTSRVDTTMDTTMNAGGATTNPLPPDSDSLQKLNNTSTTELCPSNTKTQTVSTK
jgi:hypothetical protein